MEAITVMILALLGVVGGRNILLSKEEHNLQVINQELSRYPALGVKPGDQLDTVDVPYPGQQSNENFIDNNILESIFKDFDNVAAINEELVKQDTKTAEAKEDDASSVKVGEGDDEMDDYTAFEDRVAIDGHFCGGNGTSVGGVCFERD